MPPYLAVKDENKNSGEGDCESDSDVEDSDLPCSFDKPRHLEPIKGAERVEHSWRVKEKVSHNLRSSDLHVWVIDHNINKHTWAFNTYAVYFLNRFYYYISTPTFYNTYLSNSYIPTSFVFFALCTYT